MLYYTFINIITYCDADLERRLLSIAASLTRSLCTDMSSHVHKTQRCEFNDYQYM
jgi:hypothetical protein